MELIKVGLKGYRRFRERQEMDVDGKLIAVVGPNESGKSSFLEALRRLDDDAEFALRDRTRPTLDSQPGVWARYVLDDDDRAAVVADIPEAVGARQLLVSKGSDGVLKAAVEGTIVRDVAPRAAALKRLRRVQKALKAPSAEPGSDEEMSDEEREAAERWAARDSETSAALEALSSTEETLDGVSLQSLRELVERLEGDGEVEEVDVQLATDLAKLLDREEVHPAERTAQALIQMTPSFVFFDQDARDLHPAYSFDEEPPREKTALHNFLALAGTSWDALTAALEDAGQLKGIVDAVDTRLATIFTVWQQSKLTVSLQVLDRTLYLLVKLATTSDYVGIDERSDGLRQFIALRAFLHVENLGDAKPILLIDEAETHLHYDGQADLVGVLEEQEEAAKVIYSTHSAGCLPPDLGTGVRIVAPDRGKQQDGRFEVLDTSSIVNWFWTDHIEGLGFSPVLVGMGASTFAFASTRRAVIAEGAADAILLPTLLREATGRDKLDFQIAPGLSNVSHEAVRQLDLTASRVAYLVDGDQGGCDLRNKLEDVGIPDERIFALGDAADPVELEDLVDPHAYRAAVLDEITRWNDSIDLEIADLPRTGRVDTVAELCREKGIEPPGKRAVAYRLLDLRREGRLVDPARRKLLVELYDAIVKLLGRPAHERER